MKIEAESWKKPMNSSRQKNEATEKQGGVKHIDTKRAVVKKVGSDFFAAKLSDRLIWGRVNSQVLRFSPKKYRIAIVEKAQGARDKPCVRQVAFCDKQSDGPLGFVVQDGVATNPPLLDAPCFTQDINGFIDIGRLQLKQIKLGVGVMKLKAGGVDKRKLNPVDIVFYSPAFGKHTMSASCAFSITGRRVAKVKIDGAVDIPEMGMAVAINAPKGALDFRPICEGQNIELLAPKIKGLDSRHVAFQGQIALISNAGYSDAVREADYFRKAFPDSLEAPTENIMEFFAVGITPDHNIVMATLSHNAQQTEKHLPPRVIARLMKDLGCVEAMSSPCHSLARQAPGDEGERNDKGGRDNSDDVFESNSRFPTLCIQRV
jgi:hypothetical protein